MKIFEDIKGSFEKQNKILMICFVICAITLFISASSLSMSRQFFAMKNKDIFSESLTVSELCYLAFDVINKGSLNDTILAKPLIEGIRSANFRLSVSRIYPPIVFEDSKHCVTVTRDERGLRAFEASYSKSKKHPLGILVTDITEIQIDQNQSAYGDPK
jgi:hypothetical protein